MQVTALEKLPGYQTIATGPHVSVRAELNFSDAMARWDTMSRAFADKLAAKLEPGCNAILEMSICVQSFPDTNTVKIKAVGLSALVKEELKG